MNHDQVLQNRVGAVRTRVRLLITQQWICIGLTGAALAALLLVAATKLRWWTDAVDYIWALLLAGAVIGLIIGWTRQVSPMVAAQIADENAGLKERLSTAVELARSEQRSEIAEAQIADAAQHASDLQPSRVLPWRAPKQWRHLLAAVALLLAVLFVPNLPIFKSAQEKLDQAAMAVEGEHIQKVAKQIEKKLAKKGDDSNEALMRRITQEMKQLGKDMKNGRIPKKQAMLKANDLQKALKEAENRTPGGKSAKSMDKVSNDLREAARQNEQQGNNEAANAMRQMAENLEKRDMEGAKKQLEDLAKKMQSGQMTPKDARDMANALEQMAKAMQGSNLNQSSEQMKEAAKQLQQASQAAKQLEQKLSQAKTEAERKEIGQQMAQAMRQSLDQAGQQAQKAGNSTQASSQGQQSSDQMQQMSQALQSAQQSMQQAGQQQQGQQGQQGQNDSSQAEMGKEFGQGQQQGQGEGQGQGQGEGQGQGKGQGQGQGQGSGQGQNGQSQAGNRSSGKGSGRGGPGQGVGGNVGPQQPLPGQKVDKLNPGQVDPRGKHLSRTYKGTPDPVKDKAAYYDLVPERVRAAEASMNREEIPTAVKKPVQKYFDAIQPK